MAALEDSQSDLALQHLQSKAQADLLDAIDRLRLAGLQAELNLPQLIVCGDQSSGKSSVLEAISGVRFPASDIKCTRFASELVLRKAPEVSFSVSIVPAASRSPEEQNHLKQFASATDYKDTKEFPKVIDEAAKHMEELENDCSFFEDKLVAVVRGPTMPRLTLVDLPGLIHTTTGTHDDKDTATVGKIVESYMAQPGSIILAVVAANNNIANQVVLHLVKKHDPDLCRTLGIITKPDTLSAGSPSEAEVIKCAHNRIITLDSGWHVLRNREYGRIYASSEERDDMEAKFLASGNWTSIPEENRGVSTLRSKLGEMLFRAVRGNLPSIVDEIQKRVVACEYIAKNLGIPKTTEEERRQQLLTVSTYLHSLVTAGIRGDYNLFPAFFYQGSERSVTPRKLRTCLQVYLDIFAQSMHSEGKRFSCTDVEPLSEVSQLDFFSRTGETAMTNKTVFIPHQQLLESVDNHITQHKGLAPSVIVPPIVYTGILSFQCSRWESIAVEYTRGCWSIAKEFFIQALRHKSPSHIADTIIEEFVEIHFEHAELKLAEKVQELLKPYKDRNFFTLNEGKLKAQIKESERRQSEGSHAHLGGRHQHSSRSTAQEVLNWVFAAYEIALSAFLDNFATLAIEFCLMEDLPKLFTPTDIGGMGAEELQRLTAEPPSTLRKRSNNGTQLQVLRDALRMCNRHTGTIGIIEVVSRQGTTIESNIQGLSRKGTTEVLAEQLERLSVSSPTPKAGPIPEAPWTAKKARSSLLDPDLSKLTPPTTPPNTGGKRSARRISSEHGASLGRSASPHFTQYREPSLTEPGDTSSEER